MRSFRSTSHFSPDNKGDTPRNSQEGLNRLREIMARLRDPQTGCPWDIEQTFASIAPYTIEEAYEVTDAIERQSWSELKYELGDLLFQSVFHARIAEEAGLFDLDDVIHAVSDKMISRHPHVFERNDQDKPQKSVRQQALDWENQKAAERAAKGEEKARTLDSVAIGLPALLRAIKLQRSAARVGFDWNSIDSVLKKIDEETHELAEARNQEDPAKIQEEFGDLLFSIVNLARHLHIDPETALRQSNAKFIRRFESIEDELAALGKSPSESTLDEMEYFWQRAKLKEANS